MNVHIRALSPSPDGPLRPCPSQRKALAELSFGPFILSVPSVSCVSCCFPCLRMADGLFPPLSPEGKGANGELSSARPCHLSLCLPHVRNGNAEPRPLRTHTQALAEPENAEERLSLRGLVTRRANAMPQTDSRCVRLSVCVYVCLCVFVCLSVSVCVCIDSFPEGALSVSASPALCLKCRFKPCSTSAEEFAADQLDNYFATRLGLCLSTSPLLLHARPLLGRL